MDMHGYFGYACISADINRYAWTTLLSMHIQSILMDIHSISMDIHSISMDIHSIFMDIRVWVGYPRNSVDIQISMDIQKYKTYPCSSRVKGNHFQQPKYVEY